MTLRRNIMGSGTPALQASSIVGGVNFSTSGAGTTSTDAALLPLVSNHNISVAANNSGVIVPPGNGTGEAMQPGDYMRIYNGSSNTLLLYPPAGGQLNTGTATTGTVSCASHTSLEIVCLTPTLFAVMGPST
jgi:hypothetical protein